MDADLLACFEKHRLYKDERRRHVRHEGPGEMRYTTYDDVVLEAKGDPEVTEYLDFSDGGVRFKTHRALPARTLLKIGLQFPFGIIEGYARVAWCVGQKENDRYEVGAFFLEYEIKEVPMNHRRNMQSDYAEIGH